MTGAHAVWNNRSTAGVSVLGNYDLHHLNADQMQGLLGILLGLAQHYGIDLSDTTYAHKLCISGEECLIHDFEGARLVGHRDVGYTSCPGQNLYEQIPKMLTMLAPRTQGFVLRENPSYPKIIQTAARIQDYRGPTVRVRLSFPHDTATIAANSKVLPLSLEVGNVAGTLPRGMELSFTVEDDRIALLHDGRSIRLPHNPRLSAEIVKITNWDRTPAWDESRTYNDNLFRGTIEIGVED